MPRKSDFFNKVNKTETCWLWTGCIDKSGYGKVKIKGVHKRSHRVSYEMRFGQIPDGLFVCHKCDVRNCVNPEHLFLGTNMDNVRDAMSKGRFPRGGNASLPGAGGHPSLSQYINGCRCSECLYIGRKYYRERYKKKTANY